ncbi:hypothetical protein HK102_007433 [Quaeritorhiza haematococci]|nr:hypothetical protein HK102_007433 [Quaeritorhiza haematococci]
MAAAGPQGLGLSLSMSPVVTTMGGMGMGTVSPTDGISPIFACSDPRIGFPSNLSPISSSSDTTTTSPVNAPATTTIVTTTSASASGTATSPTDNLPLAAAVAAASSSVMGSASDLIVGDMMPLGISPAAAAAMFLNTMRMFGMMDDGTGLELCGAVDGSNASAMLGMEGIDATTTRMDFVPAGATGDDASVVTGTDAAGVGSRSRTGTCVESTAATAHDSLQSTSSSSSSSNASPPMDNAVSAASSTTVTMCAGSGRAVAGDGGATTDTEDIVSPSTLAYIDFNGYMGMSDANVLQSPQQATSTGGPGAAGATTAAGVGVAVSAEMGDDVRSPLAAMSSAAAEGPVGVVGDEIVGRAAQGRATPTVAGGGRSNTTAMGGKNGKSSPGKRMYEEIEMEMVMEFGDAGVTKRVKSSR